jgi:hypothetical protein
MVHIPGWLQAQIESTEGGVLLNRSFSFTSPDQYLSKLFWEQTTALACAPGANFDRLFHAMNFAVTAWHMHDWLWSFASDQTKAMWSSMFRTRLTNEREFADALVANFDVLRACKQVANEVKHGKLRAPDEGITALGEIEVTPEGERWIAVFRIDDARKTDEEFFDEVLGVWVAFLAHSGLLPGDLNEKVLQESLD